MLTYTQRREALCVRSKWLSISAVFCIWLFLLKYEMIIMYLIKSVRFDLRMKGNGSSALPMLTEMLCLFNRHIKGYMIWRWRDFLLAPPSTQAASSPGSLALATGGSDDDHLCTKSMWGWGKKHPTEPDRGRRHQTDVQGRAHVAAKSPCPVAYEHP